MKLGIVHLAGFPAAIAAGIGCGTVLVLEEPPPPPPGPSTDGGAPGIYDAGTPDVPKIPDASCDVAACTKLGGNCASGACRVDCTAGACGKDAKDFRVDCPPGTDCQIICGRDQCDGASCHGGRCTFECAGANTCKGAACSGESCTFRCTDTDSCKGAALHCDGGVCLAECSGESSCTGDKGIDFSAGTRCGITCTGVKSCTNGAHPALDCGSSPEAKIVCSALDACKDSVPTCAPPGGASCLVQCSGGASCAEGACCDASEDRCAFQGIEDTCD